MDATERAAFLAAIRERPDDDTVRLVYADFLEEHGEPERAEFIRVQIELFRLVEEQVARFNDEVDWHRCTGLAASWCPNCGDCSCRNREESMSDEGCPLHAPASLHCCLESLADEVERLREREAEAFRPEWLPAAVGQLREWYFHDYPANHVPDRPFSYCVRRGFAEMLTCSAEEWLANADGILAEHPVAEVRLTSRPRWIARAYDGAPWQLYGDPANVRMSDGAVGAVLRHKRGEDDALDIIEAVLAVRWPGIEFTLPP